MSALERALCAVTAPLWVVCATGFVTVAAPQLAVQRVAGRKDTSA